jgi:hypothetical protein
MKKRCVIILTLVALFLFPIISAAATSITIVTAPHLEVQVVAFDPNNPSAAILARDKATSDRWGDVNFTLEINKDFDLKVFVKDGSETLVEEYYRESYDEGEDLYLELLPPGTELIIKPAWMFEDQPEVTETNITLDTNETESNVTAEIIGAEAIEEASSFLTGNAISTIKEKVVTKNNLYYLLGILVLGGMIIFGMKLKNNKPKKEEKPREIRIKKLSELKEEQKKQREDDKKKDEEKETNDDKSEGLTEAEKRLKTLERKISELKNKDKEDKVKQQIIEKEQELMKLRNESN